MSAYLEEITIRGYKSIRELQSFKLQPGLNVLIGANGSGKTNFIRFFELLGNIFDPNKGLQNYVRKSGGADALLFRGMKVTPELSAELKFELVDYPFTPVPRCSYQLFLESPATHTSLFFADEIVSSEAVPSGLHKKSSLGRGHVESMLANPGEPENLTVCQKLVRATIERWRVHHFHDTTASAKVMGLCNIVDHEVLHGDAGNVAAFLMRMEQAHPAHFARIVEVVRQVAPFFGAFHLRELNPGQTQLLWRDRYSDLLFYPHQLSDGTLRFICLATLLLQPAPLTRDTLIIDEPELGLHPFAIKLLASLLQEAAQKLQLIVSTQSSLLLDELSPEQVIVVNHHDGESTFERQDPAKLAAWLQEYTLGQLWEKNELGGLP